jgi:hypothetical protein
MARLRSPILWLGAATVVVVVAWFIVTPRRAWHDFLRALAQDDRTTLSAVVDYPASREPAMADLALACAQQPKGQQEMPEKIRAQLLQQMVNTLASPPGLMQLVTSFSVPSPGGKTAKTSFRYHGISQVDVLLGSPESDEVGLFTFERDKMHWSLIRATSQRIAALTPGP